MRKIVVVAALLFPGMLFAETVVEPGAGTPKIQVIDPAGFRDGASHWRKIRDENRVIQAEPDQPVYTPDQVPEIVANLLLFQRANGGWPKDYDMLAVLTESQREAIGSTRERRDTSFDNHNTHSQVDYLARAHVQSENPSWREAAVRGLNFMLSAQLPNGGFPQRFPDPKGYSAHITFNDGVMIGILNVLKDAADGVRHWSWLDEERRQQCRRGVTAGVACILKCQILVNDVRTGWCQQHDARTYEAVPARTFELASICPQDTTEICRFLMRIEPPTAEIVAAVDDAATWLTRVALAGVRVERIPAPVVEFIRHRSDDDVVVRDDPAARRLWARHYEIGTDRPVFAGRDAVKRYALSEIERERRTGTVWYGNWPEKFLGKEYPRWRMSQGR
jgi:PelA/Pel-15E family pectate lyase